MPRRELSERDRMPRWVRNILLGAVALVVAVFLLMVVLAYIQLDSLPDAPPGLPTTTR